MAPTSPYAMVQAGSPEWAALHALGWSATDLQPEATAGEGEWHHMEPPLEGCIKPLMEEVASAKVVSLDHQNKMVTFEVATANGRYTSQWPWDRLAAVPRVGREFTLTTSLRAVEKCNQCQHPWHDGICECGGWGEAEERRAAEWFKAHR